MRSGVSSWAFGLLFALLAAGSAYAQDDGDWEPHDRVVSGQIQPLDRILPEIRRTHPGTFYDAEGPFTGPDGEMHYRLKWMTPDGRVVWYDANARTGRVLGSGSGRRDYQSFDTGPYNGGNGNGRRFRDEGNDGRDRFGPDGYNGQGNGAPPPPPPPGWGGQGHGNGRDWGGQGWGNDRGDRGGWGGHGGHGGWPGGGGGGHHGGGHGGHGGF